MIKKVFKYVENLWIGKDGKLSLRSAGAISLIIDFIVNVHNSAGVIVKVFKLVYKDKNVDASLVAAIGGNLAQIAMILGIEAALIASLLGLKAYSDFKNNTFTTKVENTSSTTTEQPLIT